MKLTSYWLDTAPAGPDRSQTDIAGNVDVALVGGGLTGTSAALHLARKVPASRCWRRRRWDGVPPAVTEAWPRRACRSAW